jgi:2-polyprenyl-3-methyl-5-hydroxy-6-metoxy-1,4-benzoquinol methylase
MATRWVTDNAPGHSQRYTERFRQMAAQGKDLAGEARLVDAMLSRGARVLDAGCGPGRVGADLAARGHTVVGVDADPELIAAAEADHPGPRWLVADLSELDLAAQGEPLLFDAAVLAGNVMPYVAPGTEPLVLARVAAHVRSDGIVVIGFSVDRRYPLHTLDAHAQATGLNLESRFATWDLRPFQPAGDYAVTVFRRR